MEINVWSGKDVNSSVYDWSWDARCNNLDVMMKQNKLLADKFKSLLPKASNIELLEFVKNKYGVSLQKTPFFSIMSENKNAYNSRTSARVSIPPNMAFRLCLHPDFYKEGILPSDLRQDIDWSLFAINEDVAKRIKNNKETAYLVSWLEGVHSEKKIEDVLEVINNEFVPRDEVFNEKAQEPETGRPTIIEKEVVEQEVILPSVELVITEASDGFKRELARKMLDKMDLVSFSVINQTIDSEIKSTLVGHKNHPDWDNKEKRFVYGDESVDYILPLPVPTSTHEGLDRHYLIGILGLDIFQQERKVMKADKAKTKPKTKPTKVANKKGRSVAKVEQTSTPVQQQVVETQKDIVVKEDHNTEIGHSAGTLPIKQERENRVVFDKSSYVLNWAVGLSLLFINIILVLIYLEVRG